MAIYEYVDPTVVELKRLLWSTVTLVAEQAAVTEADALYQVRRKWMDELKAIKVSEAIDYRDDGRAATWRVRLMVWRKGPQGQADLHADSDAGARFDQYNVDPGATLIHGLPAVADWVLDLCGQAHPGATLEGLDKAILTSKTKSLRVALSNSRGHSVWRINYIARTAARVEPGVSSNILRAHVDSLPTSQGYLATVYVEREESPRHFKA